MTVEISAEEMFGTLTGFDEIAVSNAFNAELTDLAQHKQTMFMRALVFVNERRNGLNDADAKKAALELPMKDVTAYFAESEPEFDPSQPETEEGKGSSVVA